jgi:hypothetical protein
MKYAVQTGSGAMICISSFIKIGLGIQKFMGDLQTHRQHGDLISLLLFFLNKESGLKILVLWVMTPCSLGGGCTITTRQ